MSDDHAGHRNQRYREHRPWQDLDTMLSVDDARERILSCIEPTDPVAMPLLDAHGLFLAQPNVAESPVPPFRNSAMDGYAVRSEDLRGASYENPVSLSIIAELAAGHAPTCVVDVGQAVRIMTGAVMPHGADAVVRFEETDEFLDPGDIDVGRGESSVRIFKSPRVSDNVREAGEDVAKGVEILPAGRQIGAAELGLLAAINKSEVVVHRRPRVGILATGDEVVDPGQEIRPGQIRNSNNYTLAGLVRECGGDAHVLGVARDNTTDLQIKLAETSDLDLLLTSGGVSLGDYDVVKDVLQSEGRIDLWQVRIKPGKPMAFGHIGEVPVIGLPGNPVAAYVAFLQFGRPAILRLMGSNDLDPPTFRARLLSEHENRGHRRHYVRGTYRREGDEWVVEPIDTQGSGVLTSITRGNCLFVIPENLDHAPAGLSVDVIPLIRFAES